MHTERGFDRLVNFSDAVVAIAITLLILPLVDTATELNDKTVSELLVDNWLKLLVFVISFAVIGRFWLAHHRMYENIAGYNKPLLWVNLFWLLTIVFLPFPTELIAAGSGDNSPATSALYVGTMVLSSFSGTGQMIIILRSPELQTPEARGTLTLVPSLVASSMMFAVFLVVVIFPQLGLFSLFGLALTGPVQAIVERVRRRSATPVA
ncbi:TMEM175 family protein [Herbiconiux sp. CPCC 205763]|uniref:TMEM175 family protein n=1 Tax=Herbiconiux aconitum TaxID=2970913 RepID=A0ABT2GNR2_9MICO|nr:TMEM175 family protein [Herbiconiux aconitum]MCS5717851.1 TMEM175 family protein [Herbiconiux aconitum]